MVSSISSHVRGDIAAMFEIIPLTHADIETTIRQLGDYRFVQLSREARNIERDNDDILTFGLSFIVIFVPIMLRIMSPFEFLPIICIGGIIIIYLFIKSIERQDIHYDPFELQENIAADIRRLIQVIKRIKCK